jgi:hypothetical protein
MTTGADGPIPMRALLVLTAAVLAAHGVVVHESRLGLLAGEPSRTRVFTTRVLEIKANVTGAEPALPRPTMAPSVLRRSPVAKPPATGAEPASARDPAGALKTAQEATAPAPPPALPAGPPEAPASVPRPLPVDPTVAPALPVPAASTMATALPKDSAQAARNYSVPGSVRLRFKVEGLVGRRPEHYDSALTWLHDGTSYEARLEFSSLNVVALTRTSVGAITGDGLAPRRYGDKRLRSEVAAHFERDRGRIVFSNNAPEATLQPGAQDQLSLIVQIAAMVAGEPGRYPVGSAITLPTVSARSADPWTFTVEQQEKLDLPGGSLDTLKLVRMPRAEHDQKIELWFAPRLGYLPARIQITESNGNVADQRWLSSSDP